MLFSLLGKKRQREKKSFLAFGAVPSKKHGVPLAPLSPWRQVVEGRKKAAVNG